MMQCADGTKEEAGLSDANVHVFLLCKGRYINNNNNSYRIYFHIVKLLDERFLFTKANSVPVSEMNFVFFAHFEN